jgi:hypothetical protein
MFEQCISTYKALLALFSLDWHAAVPLSGGCSMEVRLSWFQTRVSAGLLLAVTFVVPSAALLVSLISSKMFNDCVIHSIQWRCSPNRALASSIEVS